MKKIVPILLSCLTQQVTAEAASFDCLKAATKVEQLICADAELSKLDEELDSEYDKRLQDEKLAGVTRHEQKLWMRQRNGCLNVACVKLAYETRLSSLRQSDGMLSYEGSWCTNPCLYGSAHRPQGFPCRLDIGSSTIQWDSENKHFEKRYALVDHTSHSAAFIITGGDNSGWHGQLSNHDMKWKIDLEANFSKVEPFKNDDSLLLSNEQCIGDTTKCGQFGERFYITRRKEECPGE